MKTLLGILSFFSLVQVSFASSTTTPFTAQVYYYGSESNQKTPVKFDIWWDCTNKSFWSHWDINCGYARTEVTSDQNGQIRVPAIKYNTGDRNTFRLTIYAGNSSQEINLSNFDDLKKVASKVSVYKINNSVINLSLKSGISQSEWIKKVGREGEIRISGKANHPNLKKLDLTTFGQIYLSHNMSSPIQFSDRYMILNGNDYGASLGFDLDFSLYSFSITGDGNWLAHNQVSIQYPQALPNQTLAIDDTKIPVYERSIIGHWSSIGMASKERDGNGVFYVEMDLDCKSGQAVGEISLTNTMHKDWSSKSLVRGTCDVENEKANLEFDINLGKGIQTYTFAITSVRLDNFLSKKRLQLMTSFTAYFCEFVDKNGKVAVDGELNREI